MIKWTLRNILDVTIWKTDVDHVKESNYRSQHSRKIFR